MFTIMYVCIFLVRIILLKFRRMHSPNMFASRIRQVTSCPTTLFVNSESLQLISYRFVKNKSRNRRKLYIGDLTKKLSIWSIILASGVARKSQVGGHCPAIFGKASMVYFFPQVKYITSGFHFSNKRCWLKCLFSVLQQMNRTTK